MKDEYYQIETEKYHNSCHRLSDTFLYFKRTHFRQSETIDTDVFADFWSLSFLPINSQTLFAIINEDGVEKEITIDAPICVYIPPHSIIKWRAPSGVLLWHAIISTQVIKTPFQDPVAIRANISLDQITDEQSVAKWLAQANLIGRVGANTCRNVIAEKAKAWIDKNYFSDLLISDLSDELGVSNAYITKEFKKAFGLSPVEYRNKKRVYKAMQLFMFSDEQANQVAHEVGFGDYSRFTKNFHHMMNASPREFKQHPLIEGTV